jgi:tRNA pseudouridine13 synthase
MGPILAKVANDGFINYFGLQRFGRSQNTKTHEIGRMLVKREFQEAFKAILWQDNDYDDVKEAKRRYFDKENGATVDSVLRILPKNYNLERSLLEGMKRLGKSQDMNYLSAIANIPRNMRNLYPHAYQSFLWNTCASLRFKNYGNQLALGDLVLRGKQHA